MDKGEKKALDDIEKFGCHIINVMEGDDEPKFSYSIGIQKTQGNPDLIIFGLDPKISMFVINEYYRRISSGERFAQGTLYSGFLERYDVCFIEVDQRFIGEYFGWGVWYYKNVDFQPWQVIWPSTKGKWPWDSDRTEYYDWCQPVLTSNGALAQPG